jgi:WD40 repeat protein
MGIKVIQTTKPHDKSITKMTINPDNTILVTGGDDCTLFFFQILVHDHVELIPIGYIRVPNPVTCLTWHFEKVRNASVAECEFSL